MWKYLLLSSAGCSLRYWQNLHIDGIERTFYFPKLFKSDADTIVKFFRGLLFCNDFMLRVHLALVTNTSLSIVEFQNLVSDQIQFERSHNSKLSLKTYNTLEACNHQMIFEIHFQVTYMFRSTYMGKSYFNINEHGYVLLCLFLCLC